MWEPSVLVLAAAVAVVASFYSAVGHGGASGYIAVLSFTSLAGRPASNLALAMNLVVASIAFHAFRQARASRMDLALPLLAGSVPMSYVGGLLPLTAQAYRALVAVALAVAAMWLLAGSRLRERGQRAAPVWACLAVGGAVGLLSGAVGIGGGVFLSPILLFFRWADARQTAYVSAVFIVANSLSGLAARDPSELALVATHWSLPLAAVAGSLAGSRIGAFKASAVHLRAVLAGAMALAALKFLVA